MRRIPKDMMRILMASVMLCCLDGCGGKDDVVQPTVVQETQEKGQDAEQTTAIQITTEKSVPAQTTQAAAPTAEQDIVSGAPQAGEHLDVIEPDPADDDWYTRGVVYKNEKGDLLEVHFDDEGMLDFAVNGLSLYFAHADQVQLENNWRIYSCDDGTMIVYYPGEPAHIEISGGEYEGLYEGDSDR